MTTIAFGCDHAGFPAKKEIMAYLASQSEWNVLDYGTHSDESVDYPDFVHPVAKAVSDGIADWGILCCGSGNGVAITANKYQKIRAAICWNTSLASLARQHNNANIVCLPVRFIQVAEAIPILEHFAHAEFEGGRHARRVNKITAC